MLIKLNIRFRDLFKKYLQSTSTTSSGYSSSRFRYIYFYEWSDMLKGVKSFTSATEFFKFLKECNISYTDEQRQFILNSNWCYTSCIPNQHILLVSKQYYDLKSTLDKLKSLPPRCTALTITK